MEVFDLRKAISRMSKTSSVAHFPIPSGINHSMVLRDQSTKIQNHGTIPTMTRKTSGIAGPVAERHVTAAIHTPGPAGVMHRDHLAHLVKHTHSRLSALAKDRGAVSRMSSEEFRAARNDADHAGYIARKLGMTDHETKFDHMWHVFHRMQPTEEPVESAPTLKPKKSTKYEDERVMGFVPDASPVTRTAKKKVSRSKTASKPSKVPEYKFGPMEVGGEARADGDYHSLHEDHPLIHRGIHHVFGNIPDGDFHRYIHQVYDAQHPDLPHHGYKAKLHQVYVNHNPDTGITEIDVRGHIHSPEGYNVGSIHRSFIRDAKGRLHVHHHILKLDEGHKGGGIGQGLSRSAMKHYQDLGVHEVSTDPHWDGRYVWARMGFNWDKRGEDYVKKSLPQYLEEKHDIAPDKARKIAKQVADKAWKVAALNIDGEHVGKSYLLDDEFHRHSRGPWSRSNWPHYGHGTNALMKFDKRTPGFRHMKDYLGV